MRAITVINTAHVKALSAFKSFRKVLHYIEKAGMQWPEALPPSNIQQDPPIQSINRPNKTVHKKIIISLSVIKTQRENVKNIKLLYHVVCD